jgi:hypothetical protein
MNAETRSSPGSHGALGPRLERAARLLGQRVAGWEHSAKWHLTSSRTDSNRRVVGFRLDGLDESAWAELLGSLAAPPSVATALFIDLHRANFGYLATEAMGAKAYLEFPARLQEASPRGRVRWAPPGLWARAVKWRFDESRVRHTEYWLVPGATLAGFAGELHRDDPGHPLLGMLEALNQRRPLASVDPDCVTLYEVRHDDGARAWDLNVYGFECRIDRGLIEAFDWSQAPADANGALLGHVAAGRDRHGEAYRTVYWRVDQPR